MDGECVTSLRLDAHGGLAGPRVLRLLDKLDLVRTRFDRGLATDEQIHVEGIILVGVRETRHGRNEPGDIRGAARTAKPGAARVTAGRFQRVRIEEPVAFHRNSRQGGVVQRAFQDIDILGVVVHEEHAVVPKDVSDRGARFAVGGLVGQFVGFTEALVAAAGADASGDIELGLDYVVPDRIDRLDIRHVPG